MTRRDREGTGRPQHQTMDPDLRIFVDRVIVPALVERFLRETAAGNQAPTAPARPAA